MSSGPGEPYAQISRGRGYRGSYDTVKRFVQPLREVAVQAERVLTRFETPPGWQSQVNWGQGRVYFGQRAVVQHFFVLTLGYSRRGFYCAYPDEKLGCFLEAHERAFEHFGGHIRARAPHGHRRAAGIPPGGACQSHSRH